MTVLDERPPPGTYSICPVCGWEDDPVQYDDPDHEGGGNVESLNQVRAAFDAWRIAGMSPDSRRRAPLAEERP